MRMLGMLAHLGWGQSMRALIADDNLLFQEALGALLADLGYDCCVVSDGTEMVQLACSDHFDLIVTDLNMAPVDGLTALRRLREGFGVNVPVVVVSGEEREGVMDALLLLGVEEFVQKPFTVAAFAAAVRRAGNSTGGLRNGRPQGRRVNGADVG